MMLALTCLQTHGMLMLGVFLAAWSLKWAWYNRDLHGWRRLVMASIVAIGVLVGFYVLFWLATAFDPIRTFKVAIINQKAILAEVGRPWPLTVPWDVYDVILGTGWISLWLMICYFAGAVKTRQGPAAGGTDQPLGAVGKEMDSATVSREIPRPVLCAVCLLQPVAIAMLHVLPGEAARLYAFMFPLMLVPVGLEMSTWPRKHRAIACACLWLLGAAVLRNMAFI